MGKRDRETKQVSKDGHMGITSKDLLSLYFDAQVKQ